MKKPACRGLAKVGFWERREIAAKGGKAAPAETRAYAVNRALAAKAGRKGGMSVAPENRTFSRDPEKAREAGRKGGLARAKRQSEGAR
jgi:general stress protein YciG